MSYNAVSLSNGDGSVKQFGGAGGGGGSTSASNVSYDNTESQLAATNVQSAIDELAAEEGSVATLVITTTSTELYGQTVTVAGQYATYTGTFSNEGEATMNILFIGEYTVSCLDTDATVNITTIGDSYTVELVVSNTILDITANSSEMYSKTLTVSFGGSEIGTVSLDESGQGTFKVNETGTYTLSYNGGMNQTVEVTEMDVTLPITYYGIITVATFAAATEQQIAAMVKAADAGCIDLYEDCGWRVGQTRSVSLSAIASSGTYDGVSWSVGESQAAQTVTLVLMHQGLYTLVNSVKNKDGSTRTTCSFVCGLKNCFNTVGYMNSTETNNGSWPSSARRRWCNGGFRQAIPETLRDCFKQFNTISGQAAYDKQPTGYPNVTSQDYFALAAEKEIFGSRSYSTITEANALTQFTWYQTSSNRIKKTVNGSEIRWWERSPAYNGSLSFGSVRGDGAVGYGAANSTSVSSSAPFGCL